MGEKILRMVGGLHDLRAEGNKVRVHLQTKCMTASIKGEQSNGSRNGGKRASKDMTQERK